MSSGVRPLTALNEEFYNGFVKYREADADVWQIRMFGDFSLLRPGGERVALRNRKCEGLIALLAAHQTYGVSREFAAEVLWPEMPAEKQRESLRQVLSIIRKRADCELITGGRSQCRLSPAFRYETDLQRTELRTCDGFMPGHDGDWFEDMRLQPQAGAPGPETSSVMSGFLKTLRWCASSDPASMFALLKASPTLVRGLPMADLRTLLDDAGTLERYSAWASFWRGIAEDDLDVCASNLRFSLGKALSDKDWTLASDACFELGKVHSRMGDLRRTQRFAAVSEEIADRAKTKASKINAARLKGTLLLHWGEYRAGLDILRKSADSVDEPIRKAVVESTQAWFEAASGMYDRAALSLEFGEALSRETGHMQVQTLNAMTRAVLRIHEGARLSAVPELERLAKESYDSGSCQFGVYAEESLAKIHLLDHDRQTAATRLDSAKQNGLRSKMARTPLESTMIAAIK
jgi:hypothetical protein